MHTQGTATNSLVRGVALRTGHAPFLSILLSNTFVALTVRTCPLLPADFDVPPPHHRSDAKCEA